LRRHFPEAVFISVRTGAGIDQLAGRIGEWVANAGATRELRLPATAGALIARLHREAQVREVEYCGEEVRMIATVPRGMHSIVREFVIDAAESDALSAASQNAPSAVLNDHPQTPRSDSCVTAPDLA
jgi:GTP-binding protein HflX